MNSEPCVRLGMRISPKISEKPAESRNNKPPSVMLLTASTSVRFMACVSPLVMAGLVPAITNSDSSAHLPAHRCSALERRIVARIDRLLQEPLWIVGPELGHL